MTENRLRVCFVCPEYPVPGNIIKQNHIHNLVKALQGLGVEVVVIDLWPSRPGVKQEEYDGVTVVRFGFFPRGLLRAGIYRFFWARKLQRILDECAEQTDLFHVEFALTQLTSVLKSLSRKPFVVRCHGDDVYPSKIRSREKAIRNLLGAADVVVGVSRYTVGLVK